jgi:hypothetical protein
MSYKWRLPGAGGRHQSNVTCRQAASATDLVNSFRPGGGRVGKKTWKSSTRNVGLIRVPGPGQTASSPVFAPFPFFLVPPSPTTLFNKYLRRSSCMLLPRRRHFRCASQRSCLPLSPSSSGFQSHARRRETRRHGDVCPPSLPLLLVSIRSLFMRQFLRLKSYHHF